MCIIAKRIDMSAVICGIYVNFIVFLLKAYFLFSAYSFSDLNVLGLSGSAFTYSVASLMSQDLSCPLRIVSSRVI